MFWAHLCICTVGSHASLSVRLSICPMSLDQNSRQENNSWYICKQLLAIYQIHRWWCMALNCKLQVCLWVIASNQSAFCMCVSYWQVCSLQRQVASLKTMSCTDERCQLIVITYGPRRDQYTCIRFLLAHALKLERVQVTIVRHLCRTIGPLFWTETWVWLC